jgi:peptide/nickel transport system permease protein
MTVTVTPDAVVGVDAALWGGAGGWQETGRRFGRNRLAVAGIAFLVAAFLACFLGTRLAPDPNAQHLLEPISGPSARHWFGTDVLSRDLLARVLRGGRTSLPVGLGVAVLSTVVGTVVGTAAGHYGGRVGDALMRLVDLVLVIPLLPLAVVAASFHGLGPLRPTSPLGVTLILGLLLWAPLARVLGAVVSGLERQPFVEAARAAGASDARIVARHLLPNVAGVVIVNATLAVASAILVESTLSFLGFGPPPPSASWGRMLAGSVSTMQLYPWMTIFPGLAIFLTVLAVGFVGAGLRDALDPHTALPWKEHR